MMVFSSRDPHDPGFQAAYERVRRARKGDPEVVGWTYHLSDAGAAFALEAERPDVAWWYSEAATRACDAARSAQRIRP